MNEYVNAFKNYAVFSGRATRRDYWMFVLINFLISVAIGLLGMEILSDIYSLAVVIPALAVGARRLHDTDRTGWWQLLWIVPIVGWIVLIIFLAQPSKGSEVMEAAPADQQPEAAPAAPEASAPAAEESMTDSEDMQSTDSTEGNN